MRLLLVEDEKDMAEAIVVSFQRRVDAVDWAPSIETARDALAVSRYDVVILDILLPDGNGADVLRERRARRDATPILILTGMTAIEDRVSALEAGADDYLVKPFDLRELQARVRALARRGGRDRGGVVKFGRLTIDTAGRVACCNGAALPLTRREFSLLEALAANRIQIVSKERLYERMFSLDEEEVGLNAIETYVARLRRKLEGSGVAIRTLRGLGYQLICKD